MSSSSLFASLGAALHSSLSSFTFAHSFSASSSPSSSFSSLQHNEELLAFESDLACQLDELSLTDEVGCLSSAWLCGAMEVVLKTHVTVEAFVPELQKDLKNGDTKWLDEYLDDSVKLLDTCSALRDTALEISRYHCFIELALQSLTHASLSEAHLRRAKNALGKCAIALKERDKHVSQPDQRRSKLENCSSMVRRMGDKLSLQVATKGSFYRASYAAQVTTIFICGVITSALSIKSRRLLSTVYVSGQSVWATSLMSLQNKIKEHVYKKRSKGAIMVLKELVRSESAVAMLSECIDSVLDEKMESQKLKSMKALAEHLWDCSDDLKEALGAVQSKIEGVFKAIISSRLALLEIYQCHSRWKTDTEYMSTHQPD